MIVVVAMTVVQVIVVYVRVSGVILRGFVGWTLLEICSNEGKSINVYIYFSI